MLICDQNVHQFFSQYGADCFFFPHPICNTDTNRDLFEIFQADAGKSVLIGIVYDLSVGINNMNSPIPPFALRRSYSLSSAIPTLAPKESLSSVPIPVTAISTF